MGSDVLKICSELTALRGFATVTAVASDEVGLFVCVQVFHPGRRPLCRSQVPLLPWSFLSSTVELPHLLVTSSESDGEIRES